MPTTKQKTEVAIDDLKPAPWNPRVALTQKDPEWQSILASLKEFGLVDPLVINRPNNMVLGGHQRLAILKSMGRTHLYEGEVSWVDFDSEVKQKRLCLALNKASGRWDEDKLTSLVREALSGDALDDGDLGFSQDEISAMLASSESLMGGDDDIEPPPVDDPDGDLNEPAPPDAAVRFVQLFLTVEQFPLFKERVKAMQEKWGTNIHDTVYRMVMEHHE